MHEHRAGEQTGAAMNKVHTGEWGHNFPETQYKTYEARGHRRGGYKDARMGARAGARI